MSPADIAAERVSCETSVDAAAIKTLRPAHLRLSASNASQYTCLA
jgi:hypothetical protein